MKKRNKIGIFLLSFLPMVFGGIATGNIHKSASEASASSKPLGSGFFEEDFSGSTLDSNYTKFDVRNGETATLSGGEAELKISNGSYRTVNNYSGEYQVDFDLYNTTELRFTLMLGNSPDGIGYANGANVASTDFLLIVTDQWIRPFVAGAGGTESTIYCTTNLSNSVYAHFTFIVSDEQIIAKSNGNLLATIPLDSPLSAGPVRFARGTVDPNYIHMNNFNVTKPKGDYFIEDYNSAMAADKTMFYERTAGESCTVTGGEAVVTLVNGNFGTVNTFSSYVAKIRMYNSTEARVQLTLGNVNLATTGYAVGNNMAADNLMLVITNSFVRPYLAGKQLSEFYVSTGITNSSYSDYEIYGTSRDVRVRIDGKEVWSLPLNSTFALPKGYIGLSRPNLNPNYHIDSFSVQPLNYYFNETFDSANNEMALYNRSGSGTVTVSNGQSTFVTNNDSYATRGEYYNDFSCTVVMKNTDSIDNGRIAINLGETSPNRLGYGTNNNLASGIFRFIIMPTAIRWFENNATQNQVDIGTGLSKTDFNTINFQIRDFVFTLSVNGKLVMTHELNASTFKPGQILFCKGDNGGAAVSYVFDSIKVKGFESQTLDASITGVTEANSTETNSIFRIALSGVDYGSKSQVRVDNAYVSSLNTASHIRLNGKALSDDSVFVNGEKFINYGTGTFSFRKFGNQRGFTYKDGNDTVCERMNGSKPSTVDTTVYEIEISKGCEFPSYDTVTDNALVDTIYVTTRDYVFIWFEGSFHLADSFDYPTYRNIRIMDISFTDKGGANKALNFEFDNFNFPSLHNGPDGDFVNVDVHTMEACSNLVSHVLISMNDGSEVVISSGERFINLWGIYEDRPYFSVRVSETLDISKVDSVYIFEGAEFPSYNKYLGHKNELYRLGTTTRFIADHEGSFYKATDLTAVEYARDFYFNMGTVCYNYESLGPTETKARLEKKFEIYYQIFRDWLPDDIKTELTTSTDEEILLMYERYNYIISKYQFDNSSLNGFLPNSVVSSQSSEFKLLDLSENGGITVMAIIFSLTGVSVICIYVVMKRKKECK